MFLELDIVICLKNLSPFKSTKSSLQKTAVMKWILPISIAGIITPSVAELNLFNFGGLHQYIPRQVGCCMEN
jgi:hypothetical protein